MTFNAKKSVLVLTLSIVPVFAVAQVIKTPRPTKTPTASEPARPQLSPTPAETKKNERPPDVSKSTPVSGKTYRPTYFYEFSRPGFIMSHVLIEHDAGGKGKMTYEKRDVSKMMTDDFQLTTVTLKEINDALDRLDFLDSTESYQYERDYSHLGNVTFRLIRDGRERAVKFNWTTNKDAKFLADEYRKISNEIVWKADLEVSRENQPLESPRLLDALDSYLKIGDITDPPHLIPLLRELSNDERLPLITRNHASRLIERIEKPPK